MIFTYSIIENSENTWLTTARALKDQALVKIDEAGGKMYGVWFPYFGLPVNSAVLMHLWPDELLNDAAGITEETLQTFGNIAEVDTRLFLPTARPLDENPPRDKGMYVHRWFEFNTSDVPEAVELSEKAWETFEDSFDSNIIGLFVEQPDNEGVANLLLLTWYKNFAAWEDSRNQEKDPKSWEIFSRRHQLTRRGLAYATGLYLLD